MQCEEKKLPQITWSRLGDDSTRDEMNHNFVENERNEWIPSDRL